VWRTPFFLTAAVKIGGPLCAPGITIINDFLVQRRVSGRKAQSSYFPYFSIQQILMKDISRLFFTVMRRNYYSNSMKKAVLSMNSAVSLSPAA
jgi:hypothetical protein